MAATVFMYTIYNDLLRNGTADARERHMNLQKSRDANLRRAMVNASLPDFPLPEATVGPIFPFFQEKTRQIPLLNIILVYKSGEREVSTTLIRGGQITSYTTKEDAFDVITRATEGTYAFIPVKVEA